MISFDNCSGCGSCVFVCPTKAIMMGEDARGFARAIIDSRKCINCSQCVQVCPQINSHKKQAADVVYAVWTSNAKYCSSGGVFKTLADWGIEHGYVIVGASFDENMQLRHVCIDDKESVLPLCRSKYLQSSSIEVFPKIEDILKSGGKVMFFGTPCQNSAVKNTFIHYFGNSLFLVDFLCRGVSSQKTFDTFLRWEEKKTGGRIVSFDFRAKSIKVPHSFMYRFVDQNGNVRKKKGDSLDFPYYTAYLSYNIFREECYRCPYATPERCSNLTMADFWGIENYSKALSVSSGTSMILINDDDGRNIFTKAILSVDSVIERYPIRVAYQNNAALTSCAKDNARLRDHIFLELLENGAEAVTKKYFTDKSFYKRKIFSRMPLFVQNGYSRCRSFGKRAAAITRRG